MLNKAVLYTNYVYYSSHRNTGDDSTYRTHQLAYDIIGDTAFKYSYDNAGNITSIKKGSRSVSGSDSTETANLSAYASYTYNNLYELKRENNTVSGKTNYWSYDRTGNIKTRTEYAYTTAETLSNPIKTVTYQYGKDGKTGWNKLLTGVDLDGNGTYGTGETITYDAIGNPTSYLGANLTWFGRELKSYSKNGVTYNYKYDASRLRGTKTSSTGQTSTYQYIDGKLVYENRSGTDLYYYYDSYGSPTAIVYYTSGSNTPHGIYIATNAQGDVKYLYNASGTLLVQYDYDAWGNIIAERDANGGALSETLKDISDLCPFRYRGYYYDSETGLYYLQSRYYDPQTGRFLNTDDRLNTDSVLGYNTFAYCENNPVNMSDSTGHQSVEAERDKTNVGWLAVVALVVAAFVVTVAVTAQVIRDIVETTDNIVNTRDQSVYTLVDPNDGNKVKYIGRTNAPTRREGEHKRDPFHKERKHYKMIVVRTRLTIPEAKIAEQTLISAYSLSYLDNARREIAVGNLSRFKSNIENVIKLFGSVTEDELMDLMGR